MLNWISEFIISFVVAYYQISKKKNDRRYRSCLLQLATQQLVYKLGNFILFRTFSLGFTFQYTITNKFSHLYGKSEQAQFTWNMSNRHRRKYHNCVKFGKWVFQVKKNKRLTQPGDFPYLAFVNHRKYTEFEHLYYRRANRVAVNLSWCAIDFLSYFNLVLNSLLFRRKMYKRKCAFTCTCTHLLI